MSGYLTMGGQIVDATIVAAPKQRNTNRGEAGDQARTCSGRMAGQACQARPEGPRRALDGQIQQSQAACGMPQVDLAIPAFRIQEQRMNRTLKEATVRRSTMTAPAHPPESLPRRLQLRQAPQDPQGPHALRIHLQALDRAATQIQRQSNPSHGGTKHLAGNLENTNRGSSFLNP